MNAPGQSVRLIALQSITGTVVAGSLTVAGSRIELVDTVIDGKTLGEAAAEAVFEPPIGTGPYTINSVIFVIIPTTSEGQIENAVTVSGGLGSQTDVGVPSSGDVGGLFEPVAVISPFVTDAFGGLLFTETPQAPSVVPVRETIGAPEGEPLTPPVQEPFGEPGVEPTGEPVRDPTTDTLGQPQGEPIDEPLQETEPVEPQGSPGGEFEDSAPGDLDEAPSDELDEDQEGRPRS